MTHFATVKSPLGVSRAGWGPGGLPDCQVRVCVLSTAELLRSCLPRARFSEELSSVFQLQHDRAICRFCSLPKEASVQEELGKSSGRGWGDQLRKDCLPPSSPSLAAPSLPCLTLAQVAGSFQELFTPGHLGPQNLPKSCPQREKSGSPV